MRTGTNALEFKLWIETLNTGTRFEVLALVDSGASSDFVDRAFVEKNDIDTIELEEPIPVRNADGTENQGGPIEAYIECLIVAPERRERLTLEVTHLGGRYQIILGFLWLQRNGPFIDWAGKTLTFPQSGRSSDEGQIIERAPDWISADQQGQSGARRSDETECAFQGVSKADWGRTSTVEDDMKAFVTKVYRDTARK